MRLMFTLLAVIYLAAFYSPAAAHAVPDRTPDRPAPSTPYSHPALDDRPISWDQFKTRFGKHYASFAEEHYRSHVFARAVRAMARHNANPNRTYEMRINSLFDVETREFQQVYTRTYRSLPHNVNASFKAGQRRWKRNGSQVNCEVKNQKEMEVYGAFDPTNIEGNSNKDHLSSPKGNSTLIGRVLSSEAINIDWSLSSGRVRFQGTCGGCYAFTAVQTFAAKYSQSFGFFVPLSVQQVIDCADNGRAFGCRGGYLEGAFTYLQSNGVVLESQYPYTSQDSSKAGRCRQQGGPFKLGSFNAIPEGNCVAILQELRLGPVAVGIAGYGLQYYGSGVFEECGTSLDHAVMVVGFRSGTGWRIKNSWGRDWGEQGYGWIGEGNTCGICNMAFSIRV